MKHVSQQLIDVFLIVMDNKGAWLLRDTYKLYGEDNTCL